MKEALHVQSTKVWHKQNDFNYLLNHFNEIIQLSCSYMKDQFVPVYNVGKAKRGRTKNENSRFE